MRTQQLKSSLRKTIRPFVVVYWLQGQERKAGHSFSSFPSEISKKVSSNAKTDIGIVVVKM